MSGNRFTKVIEIHDFWNMNMLNYPADAEIFHCYRRLFLK